MSPPGSRSMLNCMSPLARVRPHRIRCCRNGTGGSLAFHLKRYFQLTLTDLAPATVGVSKAVKPQCEYVVGDMRTLRRVPPASVRRPDFC